MELEAQKLSTAGVMLLGQLNELASRDGVLPKLRVRRSQDSPRTSAMFYSAVMLKLRGLGLYAVGNVYSSLPTVSLVLAHDHRMDPTHPETSLAHLF
jgi:hypothetical protein